MSFEEETATAIAEEEKQAPGHTPCNPIGHFVQCKDSGQQDAITRVLDERDFQDRKWGVNDETEPVWALILGEEVGEVSNAILEMGRNGKTMEDLKKEITQVAAVAVKWLEALTRRESLSA